MKAENGEDGMVLLTVLLLVAVAAAVLAVMLTGEDAALARAQKLGGAAQAMAIARGGELSAVAALRRDMKTGGQSDDSSEAWARIAEHGAPIAGGRFALAIADAAGKLDINGIARGDLVLGTRLAQGMQALRLPADTTPAIIALLSTIGPIEDIAELRGAGLDDRTLARLATLATALPVPQPINLNAAPEGVMAILVGDPVAARLLVSQRARAGKLTPDDFAVAHVALPPNTGFTSRLFWVRTRAESGGATQQLTSLLERRLAGPNKQEVVAIARWPGTPPLQAPAL